jgi:thiamine biosynthesis lipoprotein
MKTIAMKTIPFLALLGLGVPGFGRGAALTESQLIRREGSIDAMGSVTTIIAYGENSARLQTAISEALNEMRRLDELLSNYKPHSEWSEMNRTAAQQPFQASDELFQLLTACVDYSRQSEGTFDVSVGPLMKVWGFYKGSGHLAGKSAVSAALEKVGYKNIILDPEKKTVRFAKEGVDLDPGGVGKGYAVDRMVDILRKDSVRSALVSAAGSSIYGLGKPPGKNGWEIRLMNPRKPSEPIETVSLCDESLSTSGSYEKFFYADGKLWSHIMDPRTGYPSHGILSISVIAPKTLDSEVWAKPYYILGRQWTAQHKKTDFKVFFCEDKPGAPCTWIN